MSYRPKIKTDANGTVKDLAIDAETVKGFTIGKSVPADAALTDTWRDVSVNGLLIADQNKGHGFNFQAGMGLHITGEDDADINITYALNDAYGDSKNPYASKTKNTVLAAPSSANGAPSFRALVANDIPSLAASKITSGTFAVARIPSLSADKITSGTFSNKLFDAPVRASGTYIFNCFRNTETTANTGTSELSFYGSVIKDPVSHIISIKGFLQLRSAPVDLSSVYGFPIVNITQAVGITSSSKIKKNYVAGSAEFMTWNGTIYTRSSLNEFGGMSWINGDGYLQLCRYYNIDSGADGAWAWSTIGTSANVKIDIQVIYTD